MKFIRTLTLALVAIATAASLTACGEETFTRAQLDSAVKQAEATAAEKARALEASQADAKLSAAMVELKKIGAAVARQGGYSSQANCNVLPAEVNATRAVRDYPQNVGMMFKEVCGKEVIAMNAERKAAADKAVARAKQADGKKRLAEAAKGRHERKKG